MKNKDQLWQQYLNVIKNLPDYKNGLMGSLDDQNYEEYYLKGFEEWVKLNKEYRYYINQESLIGRDSWYGV